MPATIFPSFAAGTMQNFALVGGKKRSNFERFTLATDVAGSYSIGVPLPIGAVVCAIQITSTVSLGTTTIAIGIAGTTGKYVAAQTFTAVNTPTRLGLTAALGVPLTAPEQLLLTTAVASLPASGTLLIEVEYTLNN